MDVYVLQALIGRNIVSAVVSDNALSMVDDCGYTFKLEHLQECCEDVGIEDVCGDLEDLVGTIVEATESYEDGGESATWGDSSTWSFYRLATAKGTVTVRFFGESNGYYSETASLNVYDPDLDRVWSPHDLPAPGSVCK